MKKINLRDYYPFYAKDTVIEVPEEVALLLREYELLEEACFRFFPHIWDTKQCGQQPGICA